MKVLCISGKAQHGKDTVAAMIADELEAKGKRVLIAHYGDLVKYVCRTFFDWDGKKDARGRHLLQFVGTDMVREEKPNYWVDFIRDMLGVFEYAWDVVLIPDTRFPNEVDLMRECFETTHIRVVRTNLISPLTTEQQNHPSEVALDDYFPDCYLYNTGTLEDLKETVNTWIKEINYAD